MKRPAPMDFTRSGSSSFTSLSSPAQVSTHTPLPLPLPMPTVAVPPPQQPLAPVPTSASHSHSATPPSSSSPDLGQHSPARQRLRLDPSDTPLAAINTLPVPQTDTIAMTTADTSPAVSSFDPPTPLLASVSLPGTAATTGSSPSLASSSPTSFLTLTPTALAASTSRSPTPTLLSIQQALGNTPSDPQAAHSPHVDPDDTPRLTPPAALRAANLRAQGLTVGSTPSASASAPPSSVPTLPPAWAMPSGATIQQHLAHQLHQAQQQLGGAGAHATPGSSSSDMDEDEDDAHMSRTSSGEVSSDDRMHVDETRAPGGAAKGMAVNTAEPAFMTTLAQRQHMHHGYHEETGGYTSGSSSGSEDDDDAHQDALTAVVAAAADSMSTSMSAPPPSPDNAHSPTRLGARQRTRSTRKRTSSSTSTSASSAAKQHHDDQPHGHLDPISGTPVDLPHPDDDDWDHDTIDFMASVPPLSPMYQRRAPLLPPISQGKTHTLVLDLDETLLHCTTVPMAECGLSFSVDFNGVRFDIYGNLRPGVRRFLRKVAKVFEVVIFTASQQVYAERVLRVLDPGSEYIAHVLHRDHCVPILGNYLKDLSVLGRDLRRTLIVDNAPQAFAYHPANGLPIRSWYDDPSDRALRRLGRRLVALAHLDDVRPAVRAMSHVHARLEGVARQSGRVPVGLAMAFSNHETDERDAGKAEAAADDSMDVDSWGSSGSSSATTNASQEMMLMAGAAGFGFATPNIKQYSLSADAYPQLWQPAVLPPTVQVKLGLAPMASSTLPSQQHQHPLTDLITSPISAAAAAAMMSVHQPDGSVAVVDRSVPMDEDVDLDHDERADAEVARVTGNYSPSPLLAPASLSSSPYAAARASLNATPLAERRGNGSPEPLRLTPVQAKPDAGAAPESTLTTPSTASNAATTTTSSSAAASTYAVTPSSPANMNMGGMMMVMPAKASNETPLPTPVTPTFDGRQGSAAAEDRMDVVTSAPGAGTGQQQKGQHQAQSVDEPGLMAAMAVSE